MIGGGDRAERRPSNANPGALGLAIFGATMKRGGVASTADDFQPNSRPSTLRPPCAAAQIGGVDETIPPATVR
jgi:hypothetical protein